MLWAREASGGSVCSQIYPWQRGKWLRIEDHPVSCASQREVGQPRADELPQTGIGDGPLIEEGRRCRNAPSVAGFGKFAIPGSHRFRFDIEQALPRLDQERPDGNDCAQSIGETLGQGSASTPA